MQNLRERIDYSKKFTSLFTESAALLSSYFGVKSFSFFRVFFNNKYLFIGKDEELIANYMTTIKDSFLFFDKKLPRSTNLHPILWPDKAHHYSMDIYIKYGYWHGLSFIKINEHYIDLWGFKGGIEDNNFSKFYISNYLVLEKFVHHFEQKILYLLPTTNQFRFLNNFQNKYDFNSIDKINNYSENQCMNSFLEEVSLSKFEVDLSKGIVKITKREREVLKRFSQGMTAKSIAQQIQLSPRTIESYLNNIKSKTGIYSKACLIDLYHEQLAKFSF